MNKSSIPIIPCFVTVHPTSNQGARLACVPIFRFDAKKRVPAWVLRQSAVLDNIESIFEGLKLRDDIIGVGAAGGADVSQPCRALGIAPWRKGRSDGVKVGCLAHLQGLSLC